MNMPIPTCPTCKQAMQPLMSEHRPRSSEWYCRKDHESILMTDQEQKIMSSIMSNTTPKNNVN